ncbi:MAG: hypothetical protein QXR19_11185 [Candidatus Jordarchaeaceae archaeon]
MVRIVGEKVSVVGSVGRIETIYSLGGIVTRCFVLDRCGYGMVKVSRCLASLTKMVNESFF